eukprot:GDKI01017752.1.p1 GENE.GDKI01017752.1~~GDKI01017752.1.p1  ORF type:complete len:404 (-),score=98.16 GDKI01017752.1:112-1323(-)
MRLLLLLISCCVSYLFSNVKAQHGVANDYVESLVSMPVVRYEIKNLDCVVNPVFERLYELQLAALQSESLQQQKERVAELSIYLKHILSPYGMGVPSVALQCAMGVSSGLQVLGTFAATQGQDWRALRLFFLAKLMLSFRYGDVGLFFKYARWPFNDFTLMTTYITNLKRTLEPEVNNQCLLREPKQSTDKYDIAVVSYCNYKGGNTGNKQTGLPDFSAENKKRYADRYGYTLHHHSEPLDSRFHPWMNKLLAIKKHLTQHDFVLWVDCDAYFFLPGDAVSQKQEDAVSGCVSVECIFDLETVDIDVGLFVAEDGHMLNSGVFMLRNNKWAIDFLDRTIDLLSAPLPHSFQHNEWHEQSPVMYLSLIPSLLETKPSLRRNGGDGDAVPPHGDAVSGDAVSRCL